jgi:predicted Zn-dependent protease
VSNILTTTGVIVAERTLFLPSAGAMLAIGGVLGVVARSRVAFALLGLAVLAGAIRSAERQLVWREQGGFFRRLEADAPTTYRAHLVASTYYSDSGQWAAAERAAQRAWQLYRGDPQVFEQYGQALRRLGRCAEALPVLAEGVGRFPDRTVARSRLIECALAVGDTSRARAVATEGVRSGYLEFEQTLKRLSRTPAGQP